ncbi:sugar ABC transporter permease [Treponema sp. HNW]|uniref:carbohydrate ABC transporter permease n=1 Tax=Treponema sp. HNW TaxID=3116654 RepID=UPI003D150FC2
MKGKLRLMGNDKYWILIMLLPTFFGLLIGTLGSLAASIFLSFTAWDNVNHPIWIGWENYKKCFTDPQFFNSIINTVRFACLYVPSCIILSLCVAILLNRTHRAQGFLRAAFFFPSLTSSVAVAMIFTWIYAKDQGLLNRLITYLGFKPVVWLGKEHILYSVTLANVWGALGEGMIIFLAALQSVPHAYYEAATVDGASPLKKLLHITIPCISPAIFFQVIITTVNALQAFEYIYMLTRRTQGESIMTTTVYLIYRNGFRWFNMGLASAQAILLSIVIIIFMLIYFNLEQKLVFYE